MVSVTSSLTEYYLQGQAFPTYLTILPAECYAVLALL